MCNHLGRSAMKSFVPIELSLYICKAVHFLNSIPFILYCFYSIRTWNRNFVGKKQCDVFDGRLVLTKTSRLNLVMKTFKPITEG